MTTINVSLSVQIKGGPPVSVPSATLDIGAYDKIGISVDPDTNIKVNVQPDDGVVSFLLIKSSLYTPSNDSDEKLTYTLDEGTSAIDLDTPQIYLGTGAIQTLLGSVKSISFSNKLDNKVEIEVLVGRSPIAPQQ